MSLSLANCFVLLNSLKRWLHFQLETGKTRSKAKEDIRIAQRAMSAAEEVITQMGDSLVLEEAELDFRRCCMLLFNDIPFLTLPKYIINSIPNQMCFKRSFRPP